MFFRLFLFAVLFLTTAGQAKPPPLTPHETRLKIEEILKAHVLYQSLTPELIARALQNYLEELDPSKTYFLDSEIVKWLSPEKSLLQTILEGYKKEDFSAFEEIQEMMRLAILRRVELEAEVEKQSLPKNVQPSEFKDIEWAKNREELLSRLVRIKAMQLETAEKLKVGTEQQFLQRLFKRRTLREEELMPSNKSEREQLVLSLILKATSSALDSQTAYFTPAEANQFMIQVQQKLFGIGAQLRDDLNGFTIMRLLEGGPASQDNKLKVGDRIIAVNNEPVVGMDIIEAVELIRGPQGTRVHLTLLRGTGEDEKKNEERLEIDIVRGEVILKETRLETSYEPYGDGVIGILHLFSFYQDSKTSSASDIQQAINTLKKEHHLKGIVLDLRNNAGGLLPQAVAVSGLFIGKGVVVSVKDNTGEILHLRNFEGKTTWDGPLIVLTNRASASAAEIVAQALQDYGRAVLVGEQTYGKGTFQTFTLEAANYGKVNPKGEYKVTRGMYYTVSGKSPQLNGVQTDIHVPGIYAEMEIGEKFSKFALPSDQIPPHFEDDLSDIPFAHRAQLQRLYKFNLQPILTTYQPYMDLLRKNSQERIHANKNYQLLLKEISKKEFANSDPENFGQADLQLNEAVDIIKDLIFLLQQQALSQEALAS